MANENFGLDVPGRIISCSFTESEVYGRTENCVFRLTIYAETSIRIQVSRQKDFSPNPYSVVSSPLKCNYSWEENDDFYLLKTSQLQIHLDKNNFRLLFKNSSGLTLSEDDPTFGINWQGTAVSCYKKLQQWEKFIGLGEKTGGLNRYGQTYTNWNTDHFGYGTNADPLYLSIPFYIGLHHMNCYGVFFDNTHKSTFNFGAGNNRFSYFTAEDGDLDYYFIHDESVSGIITAYTDLTGKTPMPPRWALGYQQCRYSYYPEKEVLRLADTFREKRIPADVIYLDIHHMEEFKVFSFDKKAFPNPAKLIKHLKQKGFKVVVILDPGIKVDSNYRPYIDGRNKDLFLKYPDGENYEGKVWPGWCVFPDFTNPEVRDWWEQKLQFYIDAEVDGFWTDMNEPATWGQTVPDLVQFHYEGQNANHKKARNVYGFQMARSTKNGQLKHQETLRPFVLSRSGFAGIQRYAAVWTGDNVASDEHMMAGVRLVNSLGLSGVSFSGYDIGGFVGNTNPQLFARWITIATFCPLFRAHTMINSNASEPWAFGEEVEEIAKNYIRLRYKLMPLIYSAFYNSSKSGIPVVKSLSIDYSFDDIVYHGAFENQFLFCDNLLVMPVESHKQITKIYLPQGDWYHLFTGERYEGNQEMLWECPLEYLPVFVKSGAILPMQSATNHAEDPHDGQLNVHIYRGQGKSRQLVYEDDGKSMAYQKGEFSKILFIMDFGSNTLSIDEFSSGFASKFHTANIYFHGFNIYSAELSNNQLKITKTNIAFLDEISPFDPLPDGNHSFQICQEVPGVSISLQKNEVQKITLTRIM